MTRLATDGVRMAKASGTRDAEWRAAARTLARHALYGMLLQPAAAGDGGTDCEGGHGPRGVGWNERNERSQDQCECRYRGSPDDSPSPRPFEDDDGRLSRLMAEESEAARSGPIRRLRWGVGRGQGNMTDVNCSATW